MNFNYKFEKKMKKILYPILLATIFTSCNSSLDKKQIEEFIITHYAEKINGDEAVENFKNDVGDSLKFYNLSNGYVGRPEWVTDKSQIKGDWFYEDSVIAKVNDIDIYGNVASVFGNVNSYVSGIKNLSGGFHAIVGKEKGRLVFKRVTFQNWNINRASNSFVWPSTEVTGALSMYNKMRYAMFNFRNNEAKSYSDSLIAMDSSLAVAHVGNMQYLYLNGERDKLINLINDISYKLDNASIAEKYYIKTFIPSNSRQEILSKYKDALIYASNDPLLRAWYAYYLTDNDEKIENVKIGLKRLPESSGLNNMMAYMLQADDKIDDAVNYLNMYMTVHPKEPNAYDSMGDMMLAKGDTTKAIEMFEKAYELSRSLKSGDEEFFDISKDKANRLKN